MPKTTKLTPKTSSQLGLRRSECSDPRFDLKNDSTSPKTPILMYLMSLKQFYDFCNERTTVFA